MARSCVFVLACALAALVVCRARVMQGRGLLLGDDPQPGAQQLLRSWGVLLAAARNSEDNGDDPSSSSSEEQQPPNREVSKRRKGPTLSVVSPLEVLRQRLRLDRAKERIRENQKQIVANEELLEKIGKRASSSGILLLDKP